MVSAGAIARFVIPVGVPIAAFFICSRSSNRWSMSKLYPPALVCQILSICVLLLLGFAWACGDNSTAKDISYLILVCLMSVEICQARSGSSSYKQMVMNVAIFTVALIIYSASDSESSEKVLLAPALSAFLIDMVLSIQSAQFP